MRFFREQLEAGRYDRLDEVLTHVNRLILYIKKMRKLVVAAVQGHAAGGGANLALAADFIIADETAKFSEPFTKIGLAPDAGAMYLLCELAKKQNFAVNYGDLETYLTVTERETVGAAFRSADFAESVRAFWEKRPPVYQGK